MGTSDQTPQSVGAPAPAHRTVGAARSTAPHATDVHVGQAVRRLRQARGCSQSDLAQAVGVTFQQVQKYECGANRISASKLLEIGRRLGAPAAYFFSGLDGQLTVEPAALPSSPKAAPDEAAEIASRLGRMGRRRRRLFARLVDELAGERTGDGDGAPSGER